MRRRHILGSLVLFGASDLISCRRRDGSGEVTPGEASSRLFDFFDELTRSEPRVQVLDALIATGTGWKGTASLESNPLAAKLRGSSIVPVLVWNGVVPQTWGVLDRATGEVLAIAELVPDQGFRVDWKATMETPRTDEEKRVFRVGGQ